ncbi:hypothetical protein IKP85_06980 [bacterium]|nr:hypothetical protein [bacterium]
MDVNSIIQGCEKIFNIASDIKNSELLEEICSLKKAIYELTEENVQLKKELANKNKYNMKPEQNYYANYNEDGNLEGKYCTHCYDAENLAIRLNEYEKGKYYCPHCKNSYQERRTI